MNSQIVANGIAIATPVPVPSPSVAVSIKVPSTIKELANIALQRRDKNVAMLRTTCVRLSEYLGKPVDELSIEVLVDVQASFKAYLKERRYSDNSVRTYCGNARRLLRLAEELGWTSEKQSVEEAWQDFLDVLKGNPRAHVNVIRFAIRNGRMPEEFSRVDLDNWGEAMLKAGRQYRTVRQAKWEFRKALADAGLENLLLRFDRKPYRSTYRVRLAELPEPLCTEIRELLVWKQARFVKGRPQWTRHRPVSAKLLESWICRLYGFASRIAGNKDVTTLASLFTESIVGAFVEWGLNVRNLSRSSLAHLSMLHSAIRHHPKYKALDLSWFDTLFDEVPEDDPSRVQQWKAKKYVPLGVLRKIPAKIRAAREMLDPESIRAAWFVHDELLILWLTTLPWRQRNLRECRLGSPDVANVFFTQLPALIHVAKPAWVQKAVEQNPAECFWQFHFRPDETKMGNEVRGVLPRILLPLLVEYLTTYRPRIVAKSDPGTLFLNRDGGALDRQITTNLIAEIVLKHSGRRMTPHLFRDAFAYAWLDAHPEDYLTLSKCLWHRSVKHTLSVYGRNFDESNGARRIDEWLGV